MLSFRLQLCFLLANLSLATEIKPQSLRKSPPYAKHKRETFREKNVFVVGNPSNEARNHKATEKTKNLYSFASNWNCLEGINNVDSSCADNGLHLPEKNISRIYNSTINQRDTYYISAFLPFSAQVSFLLLSPKMPVDLAIFVAACAVLDLSSVPEPVTLGGI